MTSTGSRITVVALLVLLVPIVPWLVFGARFEAWAAHWVSPEGALADHRAAVALLGLALLASDSFLPVPSTLTMSALGYALGWLAGGLVAATGLFLSGLIAYAVCRRFGMGVAIRLAGEEGIGRLRAAMERYGPVAVATTRSIPVLQEATSCLAGLTPMPWGRYLAALALGCVPVAFVYAAIGSVGVTHRGALVALSIVLPAAAWTAGQWVLRRAARAERGGRR